MGITIKDIARESGYAVSTVSRALNNHPDVSSEAKAKIQELVKKTGFVPNANARQLKVQQSKTVLIVVKGAFNMFFSGVLELMQAAFSDAGYSAEVHYLDEDADEVLVGEQLERERKPLGFLFLGGNVDVFRKRFATINVPSVLATTVAQDMNFKHLSCVGVDDERAGEAAADYLLKKGHTDIAVIGGKLNLSYISLLRYKGFCEKYEEITKDKHKEDYYQKCSYSLASGYRAMIRLLESQKQITAVFCMSDLIAIGAMRAIYEKGLRVPEDISVLGFDGIEMAKFCIPQLTTIRQPQKEIAQSSVKQLLDAIERNAEGKTLILPTDFIEGESVKQIN